MIRLTALAASLAAAAGCGPAAPPRTAAVARTPIALPGELPAAPPAPGLDGALVGAVEQGDALYLFARDRVVVERGGVPAATAAAPDGGWAEAVAIPALERSETRGGDPDGSAGGARDSAIRGIDDAGTWVVGRTAAGALWRVTATGDLEPIHDRLGLPPGAHAIAASPTTVAIALDDGLAILRDRRHLARFPGDPAPVASAPRASVALAAGTDRIAIHRGDAIEVWSLADQRRVTYAVPGAIAAAFTGDRDDQLVVATPRALYVERAGRLRRIAVPAEIQGLAAAGSRLWVATAGGIALLDAGALVPTAVHAAAADHLFGLAGGDLVIAARDATTRLSVAASDDEVRWRASVEPVVRRVCSRCHHPGGSGRIDLSTAAAWHAERSELIRRVVDARTMPPAGTDLDDADRRALAGWLLGHAAP
jgi:hypothetical protein